MIKQHKRELRWIEVKDLHPDEKHLIYESVERKDLNISVGKSGVIQPFTGIIKDDKTVIIDGRERLKVAKKKFAEDYKVPVWVITEPLSDDQIKYLILDIERTRQKTYVDLMSEYELYNRLIPNRTGEKKIGKYRIDMICDLMGISSSKLNKLLRVDRINPVLLQAVDSGLITLEGARRKAEEIKRKRDLDIQGDNQQESIEDKNTSRRVYQDREINLTDLSKECPSCNRPFATIQYEDILEIFNVNRKVGECESDWLRNAA